MMALFQMGPMVENQFGSLMLLFLTAWSILIAGSLYSLSYYIYALILSDPGVMYQGAVGYSGILFTYSLIESWHATVQSRSLCGVINVPTKVYPIILLMLLSVIVPSISFMGHLCGIFAGLIMISSAGPGLFLPSIGKYWKNVKW